MEVYGSNMLENVRQNILHLFRAHFTRAKKNSSIFFLTSDGRPSAGCPKQTKIKIDGEETFYVMSTIYVVIGNGFLYQT